MALKIEPLDRRKHIRSNFCCGKESLDRYIRERASQDLKRRISTVFVLIDEPELEILAYYTLSSYTVEIAELDRTLAKSLPRYPRLPATLLGRLAVDRTQQGKRLGKILLIDALAKSLATSVQVASLAVIVEALDEEALNFYLKYGFRQFQQETMKLYLPMKSIEELCQTFGIS